MKSRLTRLTELSLIALTAALAAPVLVSAQQQNVTGYTVVNLGTLGGSASGGIGINNRSWVTGYSTLTGDTTMRAALWVDDLKFGLDTLGGDNSGIFWPVKNDRGLIVGVSETADMNPLGERWSCGYFFPSFTLHNCLGFAWRDGAMTGLPPFPDGFNSYASGANNRGQIVGWAENGINDSSCVAPQVRQFRAAIWRDGEMQELSPFADDSASAATAINDKGQVVGISGVCDRAVGRFSAIHAVLWQNDAVTNLGNLGGHLWNTPTAINNRGEVAGFGNIAGEPTDPLLRRAFYWSLGTGITRIDPLPGDLISFAWGINNRGQVAGQSIGAGGSRAFIWQNGVATDVNDLVPTGSITVEYANDINDRGEITGGGCFICDGSDPVAVKLIPASEAVMGHSAANPASDSRKIKITDSIRRQLQQRMAIDPEGR